MKGIQIILGNAGTQLEILETPECNVVDERPTPIEVLEEETLGRRAWLLSLTLGRISRIGS